jgi:hypothetical protein
MGRVWACDVIEWRLWRLGGGRGGGGDFKSLPLPAMYGVLLTVFTRSVVLLRELAATEDLQGRVPADTETRASVFASFGTINLGYRDGWVIRFEDFGCFLVLGLQPLAVSAPEDKKSIRI